MAAGSRPVLIVAGLGAALAAASYGVWWGVGVLAKGTLLEEFRMLVNVLAVFAFLSLAEAVLGRLLGGDEAGDEPSDG